MAFRQSRDPKIDRLARTDLFAGCTADALLTVRRVVDEVSRPAGTVLAVQGQLPRQLVLVVDGTASAYRDDERVAAQVRAVGHDALAAGTRHEHTVVADTFVRLLVIHPRDRDVLATAVPDLEHRLDSKVIPAPARVPAHV